MKEKSISWTAVGVVGVIIWHIIIGFSEDVTLAGLFKEIPRPGYAWKDGGSREERWFLFKTATKWEPGLKHPEYPVIASKAVQIWAALPGYRFADGLQYSSDPSNPVVWQTGLVHPEIRASSGPVEGMWIPSAGYELSRNLLGNMVTRWQPGKRHPVHMAYALDQEGEWQPYLGYEWRKERFSNTELGINVTVWVPGIAYNDLHVITGTQENSFLPFPGYRFVDIAKGIDVEWVPGTTHPTNQDLVAGYTRDTWDNINSTTSESDNEPSAIGYWIRGLLTGFLGEWVEEKAGRRNFLFDELYKQGTKDLLKGVDKAINQ